MELDLHSLFGLQVHSCTHLLGPRNPHPPGNWAHIRGRYWSAKIEDISLWRPAILLSGSQCSGTVKVSKTNSCDLTRRLFAAQDRAIIGQGHIVQAMEVQELSFRDLSA
jgi:hypothetical protein